MQRNNPNTTYLRNYKPSAYLIDHTDLRFELDDKNTVVKSLLDIKRNPELKESAQELTLDGKALTPDLVAIDGTPLNSEQYIVTDSTLTIKDVPEAFKLSIQTHLNPAKNKKLSGLYKTSGNFCTLCEAEYFSKMTYFLDRPDVQSSYTTTIVADEKQYPILLANGKLIEKISTTDGKHSATFSDPIKKPSYLFILVAGQFGIVEDKYVTHSGKEIKIQFYVDKDKIDQCGIALDALKKAMRWDEEHYGREYDLPEYKIVAVKDLEPAADENTGVNLFHEDYLLHRSDNSEENDLFWIEKTVGHEYFHHWTGNRVTIRDWFQVTVKEGLTNFRENSFIVDTYDPALRIDIVEKFRKECKDVYPVQPESYEDFEVFDDVASGSIYEKGAELFNLFETVLGKPLFRKGMDLYFARHKDQAVTIEDYIKALEDVSNQDLSQYLLWFRQIGTPVLEITDEYIAEQQIYKLKIKQSFPSQPGNKPVPIAIKMGLLDEKGAHIPLHLDAQKEELEKTLFIKDEITEIEFSHVPTKPIPSLLRGFSAPVKLQYDYKQQDLQLLLRHDTDIFNRFEAGKKYITNIFVDLIKVGPLNPLILPSEWVATWRYLLEDKTINPRLLAKILTIPTINTLSKESNCPNLEWVAKVRDFVITELAKQLNRSFTDRFEQCEILPPSVEDPFARKETGKRLLKNACLLYLIKSHEPKRVPLAYQHFENALSTNMTDALAALEALIIIDCPERQKALNASYEKWQGNESAMNEWYRIQGAMEAAEVVCHVNKLLEQFDFKSAHTDSLLTAFFGNPYSANQAGLALMNEIILKLDQTNPKDAVNYLKRMADWLGRVDKTQQTLIQNHIETLDQANISEKLKNAVKAQLDKLPKKPSIVASGLGLFSARSEQEPVLSEEKKLQLK